MPRVVAERDAVIPAIAEVFREHGYDGASLARITAATGCGKGRPYRFLPGGKAQMAAGVLQHVDAWFDSEIFAPLRAGDPRASIRRMFAAVDRYFRAGRRVCLVGAFALGATRDGFAQAIERYFARWIDALRVALVRAGVPAARARHDADAVVVAIQGALVLARALDDASVFARTLSRLAHGLDVSAGASLNPGTSASGRP